MRDISNFVQQHFPIWYTNQPFCLIVFGFILLTFIYWFHSRSRPALIIIGTEMLYLIPFIR